MGDQGPNIPAKEATIGTINSGSLIGWIAALGYAALVGMLWVSH